MLKYLTPYLFRDSNKYINNNIEKALPVYIDEMDEGDISVKIYNKEHTEIIESMAWFKENDFIPYTKESAKEIQAELDEYFGQELVDLGDIIRMYHG